MKPENSSVKERLILFLSCICMSQKKFADKCGLSSGFVNNISRSIQPKTMLKITKQFPQLNAGWLLTGEGEMLKSATDIKEKDPDTIRDESPLSIKKESCSPSAEIEMLLQIICKKDEQIEKMQEQINKLLSIIQYLTSEKNAQEENPALAG